LNFSFLFFNLTERNVPELPEVETITRDLNKTVKGLKITGIWTDWKKIIKNQSYEKFVKQAKNKKILGAKRRGKYILINLEKNKTIIIHQKISGHLLYGKWKIINGEIKSLIKGPLKDDPQNRFIRFIFYLNNKKQLGLCDLRRFAKILLINTDKINELKEIKELGPEPITKNFTFKKFKEALKNRKGKIKSILMNQKIIAGIGNIYSDEILWKAKIHPLKLVEKIKDKELKEIYKAIREILPKAIKEKGDSFQDYRRLSGELGNFQYKQKVYQRTGEKCFRNDNGIIKRIKVGGRSAHFCPKCQKNK